MPINERLRPAPDPDQIALKALSTRRRQLDRTDRHGENPPRQAVDDLVAASCRAVVAALEAACAEVERELDRRIDADAALARKREILVSIPGVGRRIASLVVTDMPELGALDRKAAASLAGLAPHPDQSGRLPGRNAIAGGRPCLQPVSHGRHGRRPLQPPVQGALQGHARRWKARPTPRCQRRRKNQPSGGGNVYHLADGELTLG